MMAKRSALEEAPGVLSAKRQHIDALDVPYFEDPDDDYTTPQTPSSVADIDSPVTVATTPRPKFPSDLKTLACTWPGCSKTFNRPARLRDHLNSHTNSRPFKCPYDGCDKDYIEDKHLKQHIKAAHTNERNHVCQVPGCGKSFVTGTRLKRHQAVHEGADRFRCEHCGQSFRKKETLGKHVRKEHLGLSPFQCNEAGCNEAFDSKGALKRHQDKVHGEIKFWCSECGIQTSPDGTEHHVGFTTELLLQTHIRKEHQNCMFCEYKSSSQSEMLSHIDRYHSGKTVKDRKTVLCPYDNCTKAFTKKSNLNAHIRTAHEGFRFVCGQVVLSGPGFEGWSDSQGCGDKFSTKVRLEDHVRYIHLGQERPRVMVEKQIIEEVDVITEIAGMKGMERNIACPNCNARFTRYYDLNAHLDEFHALEQLNPTEPFAPLDGTVFGQGLPSSSWMGGEADDDEIFAAEMDYGPPQDEWIQDEADIMLLARDSPLQHSIDPSLNQA